MRARIVLAFLLFVLGAWLAPSAFAQSPTPLPIVVASQTYEVNFPQGMRFTLDASSAAPIQVLRLTVWQRGVALGARFSPSFVPSNRVRVSFDWSFQMFADGGYLPPGTHGEYSWHIEDAAGNSYDTPHENYIVQDRTKKWQVMENDALRVSWHAGDANFGKAVFERAILARDFLANKLGVQNIAPLEVYIYADRDEFFKSLPAYSYEWTGARMFPEYGVILINFAPDNLAWGLRTTSHELSHAILHAKIRGVLGDIALPLWLDEGLAVYNETDDHAPDEQMEEAYQAALKKNTLIPLRALQQRFPSNGSQAQLAYGQSYQVVKFMVDAFGEEKFAELLNTFQNGALPDEGLQRVYGMNQDQLENAWRAKIGAPLRDVSVFALPTVAPLPTFEFSSSLDATPVPTRQAIPSPEPTRISELATPPAAGATPAQTASAPINSLCGVAFALGGLVIFGVTRRKRQ